MLVFGRGIFTASIVSTFILILVSFYPSDINDTMILNQKATTAATQTSNLYNINAIEIMKLCEDLEVELSINRITLEYDQALEIQYSIDSHTSDYGLIDSYVLSQELFRAYEQLNKITYKVYIGKTPILQATTNRNTEIVVSKTNHQRKDIIDDLQNSFSIILLNKYY